MASPLRILFLRGSAHQHEVILAALGKEFATAAWVPVDHRDALERELASGAFNLVVADYPL